jgi:hypothetical protein
VPISQGSGTQKVFTRYPCIRLLKARVADACGVAPEHLTESDHSLQVRLLGSGGRADLFERMDRAV